MNWTEFAIAAPAIFILGACAAVFVGARATHVGRLVFLDDIAHARVLHRCMEIKVGPSMFVRACVNMQLDMADHMRAQRQQTQTTKGVETTAAVEDEADQAAIDTVERDHAAGKVETVPMEQVHNRLDQS